MAYASGRRGYLTGFATLSTTGAVSVGGALTVSSTANVSGVLTAAGLTNTGYEGNTGASIISPASIGTNQTDYAPTGITTCRILRQATSAPCTINSLLMASGQSLIFENISANTITFLADDSATGTAALRILTPGGTDYSLTAGKSVECRYDATSSRVRLHVS